MAHDGDPQAALDIEAARTSSCARKQRLQARRLRQSQVAETPPALDDFVEIASVDELVEVLVLIAGRNS